MTRDEIHALLTERMKSASEVLSHLEYTTEIDGSSTYEGHDEINRKILEIAKGFLDGADPVDFMYSLIRNDDDFKDIWNELPEALMPLRKLI